MFVVRKKIRIPDTNAEKSKRKLVTARSRIGYSLGNSINPSLLCLEGNYGAKRISATQCSPHSEVDYSTSSFTTELPFS